MNYKRIAIITLLVFGSAGFSFLDEHNLFIGSSRLEAARRNSRKSSNNSSSSKTKKAESKNESKSEEPEDTDLLMDNEKSRAYMPDIFRCPDCGYEQDEPGFCPDHTTLELVKIISDAKNPLAPSELDGNEDILVDVPLNINFKKDDLDKKVEEKKSNEEEKKTSDKKNDKSTKKSKKSK